MASRSIVLPAGGWEPRDYQLRPWNALLSEDIHTAVLAWHRRCMAAGTPVVMADGSTRAIESIREGDQVLVWVDGRYEADTVTAVLDQGVRECITVSAKGFDSVTCTPDHEFLMNHRGNNLRFEQVGEAASRMCATLYSGSNVGRWHDPKTARFMGFMVTGGSCLPGQQPKFTNGSRAVIERFLQTIPEGIVPIRRPKGNGWDIGLSSGTRGGGSTANVVKTMLGASKKAVRRVPDQLWQADDETLWAFFSGVFDGDGSIEYRKHVSGAMYYSAKIHVGLSEGMAREYANLLRKVGIRVSSIKQRASCWTLMIGDRRDVYAMSCKLTCAHEAKREVLSAIRATVAPKPRESGDNFHIAHIKTSPAGSHKVWDISTAKHHRFIAGQFVVHNCGKDEVAMHATAIRAMTRVGNYYHALPQYSQARKAIWEARNPHTGKIRWQEAFPREIIKHVDNQSMMLTLVNGSTWQLIGSDDPDSLVGAPPVGVVFSEAALSNPATYAFFRPILLENNGWSWHISSVRGKNHFYQLYQTMAEQKDAFVSHLSAENTGIFTAHQLAQERAIYMRQFGRTLGRSLFDQEYLSSWDAAVVGAVFGEELVKMQADGRVLPITYDKSFPVDTAWDLGVGDPTVILFFQEIGNLVRLIDWYSATDTGLAHYAQVLAKKGYVYRNHFGPHDIAVREWGANGESRKSMARRFNIDFTATPQLPKSVSISLASALLDRMAINAAEIEPENPEDDCNYVLSALKNYRFKYDREKRIMSKTPIHDWTSHFADALEVYAANAGTVLSAPTGVIVPAPESVNPMRLRDIFARGSNRQRGAWG